MIRTVPSIGLKARIGSMIEATGLTHSRLIYIRLISIVNMKRLRQASVERVPNLAF
jgi:hypothetical protein